MASSASWSSDVIKGIQGIQISAFVNNSRDSGIQNNYNINGSVKQPFSSKQEKSKQ